jgi:hypothetical protein
MTFNNAIGLVASGPLEYVGSPLTGYRPGEMGKRSREGVERNHLRKLHEAWARPATPAQVIRLLPQSDEPGGDAA